MFDRQFFTKHQKLLLWLVNTSYGRDIFGINGKKSSLSSEKIIAILPNAIIARVGENKYVGEWRVHDKYSKRLFYEYKSIWKAFHWFDMNVANVFVPQLNLGFDSFGPAYPDPNPETNTVDGYVGVTGQNAVLSTVRGAAGSSSGPDHAGGAGIAAASLQASATNNQFQALFRSIYLFNTSSIGAGNVVSAATFSNYAPATPSVSGLGTDNMHLAASNPASNTALANSDYGNVSTTSFGSIALASYTGSQYNDITLNATGRSAISLTGITKFSEQLGWDINNSFTGSWSSGATTALYTHYADSSGTANDPKLTATFAPAPSGFFTIL